MSGQRVVVREPGQRLLEPTPATATAPRTEAFEVRRDGLPVRRRGWLVRRLLLAADLVGIASAFLVAEHVYNAAPNETNSLSLGPELALFGLTLPLWALIAGMYGLYKQDDARVAHTTVDEVVDIFHMVTVCTWGFFALAWVTGIAHPRVEKLLLFWLLAVVAVPIGRALVRVYARSTATFLQNVVIVGAGDVGQTLAEKLVRHPEYGLNLVGFVDANPKEQRQSLEHLAILGTSGELSSIVETYDIERVIIAFSRDSHEIVRDILRALENHWVQIDIVPRYFELMSADSPGLSGIEGIPLYGLAPRGLATSARIIKRALDVVLSGLALLALSPVFAAIAIAIRLDSRGTIFFTQPRVGQGGTQFSIFKFRTMVRGADEQKHAVVSLNRHAARGGDARMFKIASDPRITRVGSLLRRRSLDELPQLFNVLRGEMSLVGPRPLIPEEDSHVDRWARRRLELRPGMTGLWQTLGRSDIPFDEMVRLDYVYITSWSLWKDLKLLVLTVPLIFSGGRGAY